MGREESVVARRRAANAALKDCIEEVCRHYAPSGSRVGGCWEVGVLRIFLSGPMGGSWMDAATGARGDALDLVAHLGGLDAAGALAETDRFLGAETAGRQTGDADEGQMGLFGPLPESRKRPRRRSGKGRNAGASRRASETGRAPPAGDRTPRPGDGPDSSEDETGPSRSVAKTPGDGGTPSPDPARDAGQSGLADGVSFTAADRQRLRQSAEDSAWIRSHLTIRSRDARAHARAHERARRDVQSCRRRGIAASCLVLAVALPLLGVTAEDRYRVIDRAALLVTALDDYAQTALRTKGG